MSSNFPLNKNQLDNLNKEEIKTEEAQLMLDEFNKYRSYLSSCVKSKSVTSYENFISFYKNNGAKYINFNSFVNSFDFSLYLRKFEDVKAYDISGKYYASFYFKQDSEHTTWATQTCLHAFFEYKFTDSVSNLEIYEVMQNGEMWYHPEENKNSIFSSFKEKLIDKFNPKVVDSYTIEYHVDHSYVRLTYK